MNYETILNNIKPHSTIKEIVNPLLLHHFETMISHIDGIKENTNTEPVHKFRVATRRLRTVLDLFSDILPRDSTGNLYRLIEEVASLTGAARDLDVYILYLQDYLPTIPQPDQKGVRRFLQENKKLRDSLQPVIVRELHLFQESSLISEFRRFLFRNDLTSKISNLSKPNDIKIQTPVFKIVNQTMMACMEEVWSFQKQGMQLNKKTLHKMRIAIKKLRYNMEIPRLYLPEAFGQYLEKIRKIQDHLGLIHDEDVQITNLRKRIKSHLKGQSGQYKLIEQAIKDETVHSAIIPAFYRIAVRNNLRGVIRLLKDQVASRDQHFRLFIQYWDKLIKDDLYSSIQEILYTDNYSRAKYANIP